MADVKPADPNLCQGCQKNAAEPFHGCPFQQEINGSTDEEYCNCCDECRTECGYDI